MKRDYKRIILDYHFSEFLPEILANVDAVEYIRKMKGAGIESFLIYAKDHWGNVYYRTEKGHKHRNAPEDLFGTLVRLCKDNGITPYAYTTIIWDEHSARTHPEWRACDSSGLLIKQDMAEGPGWHMLCVNTPYRDFFLQQVEDLVSQYDFKGIFMDILFYFASSFICHCDSCRSKWSETFHENMPEKMSVEDRIRYTRFRDGFYAELYRQVREILAKYGKESCLLTHNHGGTAPQLPDYISKETEPFGLDYIIPQVVIKESRNRARNRETEILFGRFNRFWDFTLKSKELLCWEAVNAFSHDCSAMIIDQPFIDGTLNEKSYEAMGWALAEAGRVLEFTRNSKPYAEIAVYHDHLNYEATLFEGQGDFVGACKILAELHLPFDLLSDFDGYEDFQKYKAIVLPHTPVLSKRVQKLFRDYLHDGGAVICDFEAGVQDDEGRRSDKRHFLIDVSTMKGKRQNFIRPLLSSDAMYLRAARMLELETQDGDRVLGEAVPAALNANQWVWITHNVPPALQSDGPAVVLRRVSKGKILYFNTPIFHEYARTNLKSLKEFIKGCIQEVYESDLFVQAPSIVDAIFQQRDNHLIITFNCCTLDRGCNSSSMHYGTLPPLHMNINEWYPLSGVSVASRQPFKRAVTLEGIECQIVREGNLTRALLPPITGYTAVRLER